MPKLEMLFVLTLAATLASCASSSTTLTPQAPALPPPSNNGTVPATVHAASGYAVSVFAALPPSTKPDSLAQIGKNVFAGFGDTVNPDGTPGPGGKSQTEVRQYDLTGKLLKTYEVPGHNDGLLAYNATTLWAMSDEDANPVLVAIDIVIGTQRVYKPQSSLLDASGGLPHGGGLDDMQLIGGKVIVSGSNPTVTPTLPCPADSSTPGCPNGVSRGAFAYTLTLNADGTTFDLTPVASSEMLARNRATNANATLNITDPDSEVVAPDGSTLIVDGQQDAELAFIAGAATAPSVSFLPLTLSGAPQQVDDTRFAPREPTFLLLADTPANIIYRIDSAYAPADAYSAGETALLKLNVSSGAMTPVVRGLQAPHGLLFVTPQ